MIIFLKNYFDCNRNNNILDQTCMNVLLHHGLRWCLGHSRRNTSEG